MVVNMAKTILLHNLEHKNKNNDGLYKALTRGKNSSGTLLVCTHTQT